MKTRNKLFAISTILLMFSIQMGNVDAIPNDFVRSGVPSSLTNEIDLYLRMYHSKAFPNGIITQNAVVKIRGISTFAQYVLTPVWSSDSDALTASQVSSYFSSWNAATHGSNVPLTRDFDCRDMAAFISGIATKLNLNSRMISVDDWFDQGLKHIFTEVYGYTYNSNNGWFLIDPATGGAYISSYTSISVVRNIYSGSNGLTYRFSEIYGFHTDGWGSGVPQSQQETYWRGFDSPASTPTYTSNPWNIQLGDS